MVKVRYNPEVIDPEIAHAAAVAASEVIKSDTERVRQAALNRINRASDDELATIAIALDLRESDLNG